MMGRAYITLSIQDTPRTCLFKVDYSTSIRDFSVDSLMVDSWLIKYLADQGQDMLHCQPMPTPLEIKNKLVTNSKLLDDSSCYHGIMGALQSLTLTRPDLSYCVNCVSQSMHAQTKVHLKLVQCILWYVKGTIDTSLHLTSNTSFELFAYSNADCAKCPTSRWSTTSCGTFLDINIISWYAKKQHIVSRSSTEVEY